MAPATELARKPASSTAMATESAPANAPTPRPRSTRLDPSTMPIGLMVIATHSSANDTQVHVR